MSVRRWVKRPAELVAEFRRQLQETEMSASEIARRLGIKTGRGDWKIVKECRRYVASGMWVDRATGELRPRGLCTTACAVAKTGLSEKTIQRRMNEGVVPRRFAKSDRRIHRFSNAAIKRLKRRVQRSGSTLTRDDIRTIRRRAINETHGQIAKDYGITRRQISRIVSGERWGDIQ